MKYHTLFFSMSQNLSSAAVEIAFLRLNLIGIIAVAPITQVTQVHNKNSAIYGRSLNVIKVIFHTMRNCSFAPSGSKFFPLREVPFLKREAIEEDHCLIQ